MAHLNGISAGFFSALQWSTTPLGSDIPDTREEWLRRFAVVTDDANNVINPGAATVNFRSVPNIREFISLGTPANIVNVPTYDSATSRQIQGQADAANLELTINYDPSELNSLGIREVGDGRLVGNGQVYAFQATILSRDAIPATGTGLTFATPLDATTSRFANNVESLANIQNTAGGLGAVNNSSFYFAGRFEAILVNPQLADANQATLTLSLQSSFAGPFTVGIGAEDGLRFQGFPGFRENTEGDTTPPAPRTFTGFAPRTSTGWTV